MFKIVESNIVFNKFMVRPAINQNEQKNLLKSLDAESFFSLPILPILTKSNPCGPTSNKDLNHTTTLKDLSRKISIITSMLCAKLKLINYRIIRACFQFIMISFNVARCTTKLSKNILNKMFIYFT